MVLESRKLDIEEKKIDYDSKKLELEFELKKEELKQAKNNEKINRAIGVASWVIPIVVYTSLSLVTLKLEYVEHGIVPKGMKDFISKVFTKK